MINETIFWYQLDPAKRAEIAARYQGVPLTSLNLSLRVRKILHQYDSCMDVAALLMVTGDIRDLYQLGVDRWAEINKRMLALLGDLAPLKIYALPDEVDHEIGLKTLDPSHHNRILTLPKFAKPKGTFDRNRFWQSQPIHLLPQPPMPLASVPDLISALPKVVEQILVAENDSRQWHIVQHRFGLDGASKRTLEELGRAFDLTRERVRQLMVMAIRTLYSVLLGYDYARKPYRVEPPLIDLLKTVLERIETLAAPGSLECDLRKALLDEYGLTAQQFDSVDDLLFTFVGLKQVRFRIAHLEPAVYIDSMPVSFAIEAVVPVVYEVLAKNTAGLQDVDLLIEVNKQLELNKGRCINLVELRKAAQLCSTAEHLENNMYRCRFEFLHTRADQIERVLLEHGRPMSATDILHNMNDRLALVEAKNVHEGNLANQMGRDPRFRPIGRSGEWKLTTWSHETAAIVSLMRQFLVIRNEPATAEEIIANVQSLRPASKGSILFYLSSNKSFVEITRGRWGLANWKEAQAVPNWNRQQIARFVEAFFKERQTQHVEYSLLKNALIEKSGMRARKVQSLLAHSPALTTHLEGSDKRIAVFQPDYITVLAAGSTPFQRKAKTLGQKVAEDVQQILEQAPNHEVSLAELMGMLIAKYDGDCKSPYSRFHRYVSRLPFAEKYTPAGTDARYVRLRTAPK